MKKKHGVTLLWYYLNNSFEYAKYYSSVGAYVYVFGVKYYSSVEGPIQTYENLIGTPN